MKMTQDKRNCICRAACYVRLLSLEQPAENWLPTGHLIWEGSIEGPHSAFSGPSSFLPLPSFGNQKVPRSNVHSCETHSRGKRRNLHQYHSGVVALIVSVHREILHQ